MTEIKTKPRGILFDLWNTLIYNQPRQNRADFETISRKVGVPTEQIWRRWGSFSEQALRGRIKSGEERARLVLTDLGGPLEMATEMANFERANRNADVHFFQNVPEMLTVLRTNGYLTCLVSNCNYLTPAVVEHLALPTMLDEIVLSCQVGLVKPEAEIYQLAAQKLGLTPADCLFVGDGGDNELAGAKEAGCQVILVGHALGHAARYPEKDYPYDVRLEKVTELLPYLGLHPAVA